MKKIMLFIVVLMVTLFLVGCNVTDPIPDAGQGQVDVKIIGIEQEVSCAAYKGVFRISVFKCCPDCDSCCEECETCEECEECETCEECEECETCEECEECPDCPEPPECPTCPCYALKWGDLYVDLEFTVAEKSLVVGDLNFLIRYIDESESEELVSVNLSLGSGETTYEQVKIELPEPIKRVIFVELSM